MSAPQDPQSATVEMLTAQVRTLIIGSRQVTLSVLGQLDTVHPLALRPMGRVRPRDSNGEVHTVGPLIDPGAPGGGELVRSWVLTRHAWQEKSLKPGGKQRRPCWCGRPTLAEAKRAGSLTALGLVAAPPYCGCNAMDLYSPAPQTVTYYRPGPDGTRAPVPAPPPALIEQWEALPLLVLAGLR